MEIIFKKLPVLLREYLHMIIIRQTVRMHPLRMHDIKLRQDRSDHLNFHNSGTYNLFFLHKLNLNLIISGLNLLSHIHVNPEASPLMRAHNRLSVLQITKEIRIKPGGRLQIIVIYDPVRCPPYRNLFYCPDTNPLFYGGHHSYIQTLTHKEVPGISRLERYRLSPQSTQLQAFRPVHRHLVLKHLRQRT